MCPVYGHNRILQGGDVCQGSLCKHAYAIIVIQMINVVIVVWFEVLYDYKGQKEH